MRTTLLFGIALLTLAACATVEDQTGEVKVLPDGFYAGTRYIQRTQVISGPQGPYERTSVVFRSVSRVCNPDSPNDCEKAARALIDECGDSSFCIV